MKNLEFVWQGHLLIASPRRALVWPGERLVLIADVHLGKEATFRRHGVPLPEGTDGAILERLERLMDEFPEFHVMVLGDFFHGVGRPERWSAELATRLTLVRGNHDRWQAAEDWVQGAAREEMRQGVRLAHEPSGASPEIVGHLHPGVRLGGGRGRGLRRPCFHVQPGRVVLPAFSPFTGVQVVSQGPGDRVFVVGDERVDELGG